jgi:hypothetical protein
MECGRNYGVVRKEKEIEAVAQRCVIKVQTVSKLVHWPDYTHVRITTRMVRVVQMPSISAVV